MSVHYTKRQTMQPFEKALRARLSNKQAIIRAGGEQALSHSKDDILRIKRALNRLRTEGFGECISCGHEIPKERLNIYPEAERCTPCGSLHEKSAH